MSCENTKCTCTTFYQKAPVEGESNLVLIHRNTTINRTILLSEVQS